jgi:hypothetical protein
MVKRTAIAHVAAACSPGAAVDEAGRWNGVTWTVGKSARLASPPPVATV